jgi:hypothetical protein
MTYAAPVQGIAIQPVESLSDPVPAWACSMEATERYLGSRQRVAHAVNDTLATEPDTAPG